MIMALLGAVLVIIALTAYRRREKWTLVTLLVVNTLGWGSGLAVDSVQGPKANVIMESIALLSPHPSLPVSTQSENRGSFGQLDLRP